MSQQQTALILSGGGARAAYQVGVLRAITEIIPKSACNPFDIISGTSAGAVNAAVIATRAKHFRSAILNMEHVWRNFSSNKVYRTDFPSILACAGKWITSAMGMGGKSASISLFDNAPLKSLLADVIPFEEIPLALEHGYLRSIAITASCYNTGESISFYQSAYKKHGWERVRRTGKPAVLSLDHLMASSAIPIFFPSVNIDGYYYGDGAVRQLAPISPALHLGAKRILIIGVSDSLAGHAKPKVLGNAQGDYPSFAQISGHLLNSAFLDSFEADIERLQRINRTISLMPKDVLKENDVTLRKVDVLVVSPSRPLDQIAAEHIHELPKSVRFFMGRTGATESKGASFISYLMFEKGFCRSLIRLGYKDALRQKDELVGFFGKQNTGAFPR